MSSELCLQNQLLSQGSESITFISLPHQLLFLRVFSVSVNGITIHVSKSEKLILTLTPLCSKSKYVISLVKAALRVPFRPILSILSASIL